MLSHRVAGPSHSAQLTSVSLTNIQSLLPYHSLLGGDDKGSLWELCYQLLHRKSICVWWISYHCRGLHFLSTDSANYSACYWQIRLKIRHFKKCNNFQYYELLKSIYIKTSRLSPTESQTEKVKKEKKKNLCQSINIKIIITIHRKYYLPGQKQPCQFS